MIITLSLSIHNEILNSWYVKDQNQIFKRLIKKHSYILTQVYIRKRDELTVYAKQFGG